MTRVARVAAQAKINLLLRVLAREPSGYHQIETVFLRVDLADRVDIRESDRRTVQCSGSAMPPDGLGDPEQNLAFRAADAYARAAGWPRGFEIEIQKGIPVGAGLGGGSADAGAVLRGLDAMNPKPLGAARILDIGAKIGSDVPFLTLDTPMAIGRGRGEQLSPMPTLEPRYLVIIKPPFGVNTADAYGWLDRAGLKGHVHDRVPALQTWDDVARVASNDFEPVVSARHPEIATAVDALRSTGASVAMMSGSGSAVFGVFSKRPDTTTIASRVCGAIIETRTSAQVVGVERNQ